MRQSRAVRRSSCSVRAGCERVSARATSKALLRRGFFLWAQPTATPQGVVRAGDEALVRDGAVEVGSTESGYAARLSPAKRSHTAG